MQLSRFGLIYLHGQKTAGNALQSILLPHSDDHKVTIKHQDGEDRYGIEGPITETKHMLLQRYRDRLGEAFSKYRVAITVRHPVDRAVSLYYSPHHWMQQTKDGGFERMTTVWDRRRFDVLIRNRLVPFSQILAVDGAFRRPDFTIRFETLEADFGRFCDAIGIDRPAVLPVRNKTASDADEKRRRCEDPEVIDFVAALFADDFAAFGYDPQRLPAPDSK